MEGHMGSCSEKARLRYLNATQIEGPVSSFDHLEVRSREDRTIGRLDGILIDPSERRVRYFVVDDEGSRRHHRYLIPLAPTRLDARRRALCVDVTTSDVEQCEDFEDASFPHFSDDDLLNALFAYDRHAAGQSA
jgi:PRC-barrel domain